MPGKRLVSAIVLIVVLPALVVGLHRCAGLGAGTAARHNVVLITLDTTRADHLGCYGYAEPTSPSLDRFAEGGALFSNAYCTASVTPVSHASILTGQYPYTHGLRVLHGLTENRLPDGAVTLAEILKGAGYETAAFVSAFPAGSRFGLNQGFDTFDEAFLEEPVGQIVGFNGTVNTGKNQRRAGDTTDLALDWLGRTRDSFFMWLHFFDPHDPHVVPPREFLEQFPVPTGSVGYQLQKLYDIEIQYMDQHIGRVFDALATAGRLEDTVVVIVSDHGQGLGDHDWWGHGILFEEQIKAPFIIRGPGVPEGRRVPDLVRTIDIAPTVLELAGFDPGGLDAADGRSLVPVLDGKSPEPPLVAYADSVNMLTYRSPLGEADEKNDMLFAVTDGRWKYIHHLIREEESELYDLTRDPGELTNLYAVHPQEVERLLADLAARPFPPASSQSRGRMSPEDIERLRSLGYLR
ncbi:MAG: sulfatase family protein [Planctomycetota bacterium]|jgi:arylsulfatase A-like enzyme